MSDVLSSDRLILVPATVDQIKALIAQDYAGASELLGSTVPKGWPDHEEAREGLSWHLWALEDDPRQTLWRIRFVIEIASNTVIGSFNLKGPPATDGDVEIGWGIAPEVRGRGYATEAASMVKRWVFSWPEVTRLSATIPAGNIASLGVAQRLGMKESGQVRRGLPLWVIDRRAMIET